MDLINILNFTGLCEDPAVMNILYLVGIVYKGIQIVVPIILIIVGMIDLVQGIASQDDKKLKTAQGGLVKKAVAAVIVFMVAFIVGLLMRVIGGNDYLKCMKCITSFGECEFKTEIVETGL